ncbi:hypothetical protein MTR67_042220 [Solanum verrucosum]|uniref:GH3 C-terminal domain-containing protein n=1 Tax=Solanum verrucosum TaxID=315347 RepID=A0AAF0UM18_SOLVR|nr:hypothetical protein MTR67_042220 [Solanum verrucosum]
MEGSMTEENKKNLEFIEEVTRNVDDVQKRVLNEILTRNASVEYLQRLNLNGHTDRETFKKVMPIITYEDIQSDINRIANGNRSPILCSQLISEFFTSSGTSGGERKLIPTTEEENGRRHQLYGLMMSVVFQFFPDLGNGKGMYFMFIKSEAKTPGGLLARPILTSVYKSSHFKNSTPYTSPIESILCLDSYQSMYSQMLCGLCQNREVVRVGSIFASAFIRAMRFLEDHWVDDVLRVAGYKNNAPQFNFIRRENVILSIDSDKTNETELQNAVKNAANNLMPFDALLEECCLTIEESLNRVYRQGRTSDKSIGPLEIRIMETGTFDKLMDYCCTSLLGASINQYKTPRCVKFAPHVELLNSRVVSSYFSPVCPKWAPGSKQWNNTD